MRDITFERVYQAVKEQEKKNDCPLLIAGVWMNTDGQNLLDVEYAKGTADLLFDTEDLIEYLDLNGIKEEFTECFNKYYE